MGNVLGCSRSSVFRLLHSLAHKAVLMDLMMFLTIEQHLLVAIRFDSRLSRRALGGLLGGLVNV